MRSQDHGLYASQSITQSAFSQLISQQGILEACVWACDLSLRAAEVVVRLVRVHSSLKLHLLGIWALMTWRRHVDCMGCGCHYLGEPENRSLVGGIWGILWEEIRLVAYWLLLVVLQIVVLCVIQLVLIVLLLLSIRPVLLLRDQSWTLHVVLMLVKSLVISYHPRRLLPCGRCLLLPSGVLLHCWLLPCGRCLLLPSGVLLHCLLLPSGVLHCVLQ